MWMYFVGWFIGLVIGAIFLIQALIILFFSIPFTVKLRRMGALGINVPVHTRDLVAFTFLSLLFIGSTWLIKSFENNLVVGYYVGVGFSLLLGSTKLFRTKMNVADYIENKIKYLHPDFVREYLNGLMSTEPESKWVHSHISKVQSKAKNL